MIARTLLCAVFALGLTGCATQQAPHAMQRANVPLSETAVFAAFDDKAVYVNDVRIQAVNGKDISCDFMAGCPWWVRVEPGKYTFRIRYVSGAHYSSIVSGYNESILEVEVPEMAARHLYVVRYRESTDRVGYVVEDLGENPNFGITPGGRILSSQILGGAIG